VGLTFASLREPQTTAPHLCVEDFTIGHFPMFCPRICVGFSWFAWVFSPR